MNHSANFPVVLQREQEKREEERKERNSQQELTAPRSSLVVTDTTKVYDPVNSTIDAKIAAAAGGMREWGGGSSSASTSAPKVARQRSEGVNPDSLHPQPPRSQKAKCEGGVVIHSIRSCTRHVPLPQARVASNSFSNLSQKSPTGNLLAIYGVLAGGPVASSFAEIFVVSS